MQKKDNLEKYFEGQCSNSVVPFVYKFQANIKKYHKIWPPKVSKSNPIGKRLTQFSNTALICSKKFKFQKETEKVRKAPVSYRSAGQLPRESEVKELKIYVGTNYFQSSQTC